MEGGKRTPSHHTATQARESQKGYENESIHIQVGNFGVCLLIESERL